MIDDSDKRRPLEAVARPPVRVSPFRVRWLPGPTSNSEEALPPSIVAPTPRNVTFWPAGTATGIPPRSMVVLGGIRSAVVPELRLSRICAAEVAVVQPGAIGGIGGFCGGDGDEGGEGGEGGEGDCAGGMLVPCCSTIDGSAMTDALQG
jgi:hypothetical protein